MNEEWDRIPEFPNYLVSNLGRILRERDQFVMSPTKNKAGDIKISLSDEGYRSTRLVKRLVAEAFVYKPSELFDTVIQLDDNKTHLNAENLAWRPRWFAWKYKRQFSENFPEHYYTIPVIDGVTAVKYKSIVEASKTNGLLFVDVSQSTWDGSQVFPTWHTYAFS